MGRVTRVLSQAGEHESHSTFKRLPSNSDGRYTSSRALRRERVGPREPPAVEGASRVQVVSTTVAVGRYRRESRAVAVGSFRKIVPRKKSTLLLLVSFFLLVRTQPAVLAKNESLFVLFRFFFRR